LWNNIQLEVGGAAIIITYQMIDTVSLNCGTGDGLTFCGDRTFTSINDNITKVPCDFVTWVTDTTT
jgi:hypothetical protein